MPRPNRGRAPATIRLDPEITHALTSEARRLGVSRSELVRRLLRAGLNIEGPRALAGINERRDLTAATPYG